MGTGLEWGAGSRLHGGEVELPEREATGSSHPRQCLLQGLEGTSGNSPSSLLLLLLASASLWELQKLPCSENGERSGGSLMPAVSEE